MNCFFFLIFKKYKFYSSNNTVFKKYYNAQITFKKQCKCNYQQEMYVDKYLNDKSCQTVCLKTFLIQNNNFLISIYEFSCNNNFLLLDIQGNFPVEVLDF